jgi:ATP/maltotriose-dependent transcriptional regulator MalT
MISRTLPNFPSVEQLAEITERMRELSRDSTHPILVLAGPMAATLVGDLDGARRGLARVAGHADPWVRAAVRLFTGYMALHEGRVDEAGASFVSATEQFRAAGDRWGQAVSLNAQSDIALARGDGATAVAMLEEARGHALTGMAGSWSEVMLIPLGRARALAGDLAGGRADVTEGIRRAEHIGERDDQAQGYLELAEIARREGGLTEARALLDRAAELIEPHASAANMFGPSAMAASKAGCLAEQQGDLAAAARQHDEAMRILASSQLVMMPGNAMLATVIEGRAALAAAQGEPARAAELLGLAHALQGFRNGASLEVGRASTAIAAALTPDQADAAYARGRGQSRADALAMAPAQET